MSRCGCTSPCPACPGALYVDMLGVGATLALPASPIETDVLTRTFNIPAALPGIGIDVVADIDVVNNNEGDTTVGYSIVVDGTVLRTRAMTVEAGDSNDGAIVVAIQQLASGSHTVILRATSTVAVTVIGAGMRTQLTRSDNLTVS